MGLLYGIAASFLVIWHCLTAVGRACIPWSWRIRKDVTGEIVLITGSGSGMGRLMAIEFAKRRAIVVLWDINESGNRGTMRAIKAFDGSVHAYTVDVSSADTVYAAADRVKREVGDVSILVNNAGVVTYESFLDCPDDKIRRTMDVNVTAHFWTLKSFLPAMKANKRGHIVTMSSLAGYFSVKNMTDYCASKHAAVGLHSTLRLELQLEGYHGIEMTMICTGAVSTGLLMTEEFDFMTPEYAVSMIMEAVLLNEKMLLLPGRAFIRMVFKFLIPEKVRLTMRH